MKVAAFKSFQAKSSSKISRRDTAFWHHEVQCSQRPHHAKGSRLLPQPAVLPFPLLEILAEPVAGLPCG
jgi:hypothetical protein